MNNFAPATTTATYKTDVPQTWWKKEDFFFYPQLLVSAYYGLESPNFREEKEIPDNVTVIADSGGFQNLSFGANLDPISVLRWQEKNATIGLTFDNPVREMDSISEKQNKQKITVENAYKAIDNRNNDKLKLFAIIQGQNKTEIDYIFDKYKEIGNKNKFNGWSIGGLQSAAFKPFNLAHIMINLFKNIKETDALHVLGVTGLRIIPILIYFEHLYKTRITFDSTSYFIRGHRRLYTFEPYTTILPIQSTKETAVKTLPCDCPVCRVSTMKDFKQKDMGGMVRIYLHNMYKSIQFTNTLSSLVKDKEVYRDYVAQSIGKEVIDVFDYIDTAIEDYEKSERYYKLNRDTKPNQGNLLRSW